MESGGPCHLRSEHTGRQKSASNFRGVWTSLMHRPSVFPIKSPFSVSSTDVFFMANLLKKMYVNIHNVVVFLLEGKGTSRAGDILGSLELPRVFSRGFPQRAVHLPNLGCNLPVLSGHTLS